ncbi:acyl-CoA dehydratase activase-related protein [Actinomyces sp. HMT897]|uniref:acyl-CoA dehydratase activase-related protein n=1 Tax=Actinomyces sp. HMT897 TaxID=2789424 RepID=UPI001FEE592C|nr:acyl-CoA dehydratase activase-related protein [Actinomyces sp. HMT897]
MTTVPAPVPVPAPARPPGPALRLGLDIGSTTVKLVLLPETAVGPGGPGLPGGLGLPGAVGTGEGEAPAQPVLAEYHRHNADVRGEVTRLLGEAAERFPDAQVRGAVTGSAGLSLATLMGLPFVQEVIAETETVRRRDPQTDVIIELGGEDAKITYLHPTPEQRMNGTCAGGTGAFIDQMAQLLHTDAPGLDELASRYTTLYPIASRCGVFAKSDLQPLINQGAASEDLAASVLAAVVTQTIAGLACGRPIRGEVMFLGGPLHFLPQLRAAFERTLSGQVDSFSCPPDAQLYVALGAAYLATGVPTTLGELVTRLATRRALSLATSRMRPLFASEEELAVFRRRHARATVERASWPRPGSGEGAGGAGGEAGSQAEGAASAAASAEGEAETGRAAEDAGAGAAGSQAEGTAARAETVEDGGGTPGGTAGAGTRGAGTGSAPGAADIGSAEEAGPAGEPLTGSGKTGSAGDAEAGSGPQDAPRPADCFLGIDAGSTTIKAVVLDEADRIVWEHYAGNEGDPVTAAVEILRRIHVEMPEGVHIARSCVTGYGESLVKAALHLDEGVVETMAHYRAAAHLNPGVTSVIDIGGQDMKYLRIRGEAIDSISVNEACSAGCGSFLQTFAQSMGLSVQEFADTALTAPRPVDLGSRCTVFMNSSVKQAQKESATVGEISAGLSYSVVRNALYKVIKLKDPSQLGERVSVQGGTFLNDAVLRAFEILTGREVVRPDVAGLMGALGAALTAHQTYDGTPGRLMTLAELSRFSLTTETATCRLCQNHCKLTITTFSDGSRHVSGNRCERGATQERRAKKSDLPNLYDYKFRRTFAYRRLRKGQETRGEIGVPRVLGMYENYPLWFTVLTSLGFRVLLSGRSDHELFEKGMDSIPSENVCYPAKLAHGHVEWLISKGVQTIWFPCVFYERDLVEGADNHYNCPIVATYPEVIRTNVEALQGTAPEGADGAAGREAGREAGRAPSAGAGPGAGDGPGEEAHGQGAPRVRLLSPFLNLADPAKLAERLVEVFADWDVTLPEARRAVAAGLAEDAAFKADVRAEGRRALAWMREHGRTGIVLAGRPYHVDPEINHGVPDVINTLGMVVLSEDSVLPEPEAGQDDGAERAVATGALARAVGHLRRGARALVGPLTRRGEDPQAPADWSDVTSQGLPSPLTPVRTADVAPRLRVRDQWAYHSRLYRAAELVTRSKDLELVQLNSFGCGVDAVTTDQVQEILESAGDVYTALKIDEVSNLGAATIRLRSLAAAAEARRGRRAARAPGVGAEAVPGADAGAAAEVAAAGDRAAGATTTPGAPTTGAGAPEALTSAVVPAGGRASRSLPGATTPVFTREMRATHTILMPQMSPVHFRPLVPLMRRLGYRVELLESASRADLEVGLRYVNNDACFPAIMVIGQLIGAFTDGSHDPDRCVVAISQTGGMCRATNYAAMLRKGLREAGYPQVPVVAVSLQGIESNPGFELTPTMGMSMLRGVVIGDTLNTCLLRVRPYEAVPGSAQELLERWNTIVGEFFEHRGCCPTWGGRLGYRRLLREMVKEFDALPLADVPRRPRVGVVGEILVKFQPDANNHVVDVIEAEGCEAVVPGLLGFLLNGLVTAGWKADTYGIGRESVTRQKAAVWFIEQVQAPARAALRACGGKFDVESPIAVMADKASRILSLGNQAGEGWLLTAEMVELIEHGVPNIVCCQPFACLPNHVVGKGMFREVRRRFPQANIVAIDYDPGASEVNQLNRIKLMISTAFMMQGAEGDGAGASGTGAGRAGEGADGGAGRGSGGAVSGGAGGAAGRGAAVRDARVGRQGGTGRSGGARTAGPGGSDQGGASHGAGARAAGRSGTSQGGGRSSGQGGGARTASRGAGRTQDGDGRRLSELVAGLGPAPDGTPVSPDVAAVEPDRTLARP